MRATRDAFGKKLLELGHDERIIVISADLASPTRTIDFAEKYPDRFFEVGIAENNMIGIASGLSEYKTNRVIISSFGAFLTSKFEVIRNSIGYSKAPVIIVGTHAGLAIGRDGVTQMGLDDIGLMRLIPGMMILQPATPMQAEKITEYVINNNLNFPVYIRLGRQPCKEYFDDNYQLDLNRADILRFGSDITLFTTGCILEETIKTQEILSRYNIGVSVINIVCLKPISKDIIVEHSKNKKLIVTIEDHSIIGGLGSAICEVLSENLPTKVLRFGVQDVFPESGDPKDLYGKYELSGEKIAAKILRELNDR